MSVDDDPPESGDRDVNYTAVNALFWEDQWEGEAPEPTVPWNEEQEQTIEAGF